MNVVGDALQTNIPSAGYKNKKIIELIYRNGLIDQSLDLLRIAKIDLDSS